MKSLLKTLEESGKFDIVINTHGTISAIISPKAGAKITEIMKILFDNCPNANKVTFTEGGLDVTPALLEDSEVKRALEKQAAKTTKFFLGPDYLIIVGRNESGKWMDGKDQAVPWDKIQGPAPKEEVNKAKVQPTKQPTKAKVQPKPKKE